MADTLTPNYLTVSPDGKVGANFTGLVNALGLIIPAATGPAPAMDNQIQWQRQSDGAVVALQWGASENGTESLRIEADAVGAFDDSQVTLAAVDGSGTSRAYVQVTQQPGEVVANAVPAGGATTVSRVIVDEHGNSDFIQAHPPGTQIVNGELAANSFGGNGTGVRLVEDNGHVVHMVWTGSVLQFYVDNTAVSVA